ncbi:hypothetical protein [Cupriavidus oxalaticus]|uniref:Uncharacterized protein n=1 Tax=Cupriavidus oxalaticus TaxID=96344 RepID=A0A375GFA0_9BURK|nr:hypothetical protein [Cupriavidus oxalaticus]QRQ86286.1 hypothetical protein JTE91_24060 [Cupriavidus oxalaticus]QRQ95387.1 hypothetical protein JTE92_18200 [Cupriavidus oxalaticus]WQD84042.1 hypothetical protein U0036_05905 [Cupriavidus oxalaticus]SPC17354.1 conserved hypothetical protein [Cupriavidus oxalaticus]
MTAEQAAMRQALRQNLQRELLHELQLAHRMIFNALAVMTPEQKSEWAARNILSGNDSEGTTRAHEREAVIARAMEAQRV